MGVQSCWATSNEQPLSGESNAEPFSNTIPAIRHFKPLSTKKCARLVEIIKTAQVGTYNQTVIFPLVGTVGINQFDYPTSKDTYLTNRTSALALQNRFIKEGHMDIVGPLMELLYKSTGLPVRMAQEGEREC